ncbi:hypothetical protein GV829_11215 [Sphingomonas lacunae]|uniref:Uncharacterized protein n=1 Tax=Sphingomonas lacunae TaxID=2698828 RepID=A0A6M4AV24_9SPHN|nr:hypothetical protein [Sphingomonas lacunae]QJQ32943.1 hypothetical protein GV829_11215 [Sphingomonas lacunae]
MTASDLPATDTPTTTGAEPTTANRVVRIIASVIGLIFLSGVFVGFLEARATDGNPPFSIKAMVVVAVIAALGMWCIWVALRNSLAIKRGVDQMPRRERKSTTITIIALTLGGVTGLGFGLTQSLAPHLLFDAEGMVQAPLAIAAVLLWGIAGPWLTNWWLKQTDEHERDAYIEGANWTAHALMFGIPVWWVLWKAGLAVEPSAIDCIILGSLLWMGVWMRRKFF